MQGLLFFALAALFSPIFSASFGTLAFYLFMDMPSELIVIWLYWWLGNSIGLLVVGSFLITQFRPAEKFKLSISHLDMPKQLVFVLATILIVANVIANLWGHVHITIVLLFFALPVAALLGLAKGTLVVVWVNLLALLALIISGYWFSPEHFYQSSINEVYTHISFMGVMSFTGLLFSAVQYELKEKDYLHYKSSHDGLTGLTNREYFNKNLQLALETVNSSNVSHALLFIDLDKFKIINDKAGHSAGDEMLKKVAKVISEEVRNRDCVARWGGDEFTILFWYCPFGQARQIAENICKAIDSQKVNREGTEYSVSASIGLLAIDKSSGSVSSVIEKADVASYDAKRMGGNRVISVTE